jgi:prepilin-type N-terminal cleavage/methylation domain-containing protein
MTVLNWHLSVNRTPVVKAMKRVPDIQRMNRLAVDLDRSKHSPRGAGRWTDTWPGKCPGFTLVELLVVFAILAILAAIGLPMISGVRTTADEIKTVSQMRNLALATLSYAGDNGGRLPGHVPESWDVEVLRYLQGVGSGQKPGYDSSLLQSPWDKIKRANPRSYSYSAALNNWFGWHPRFPQYTGAPQILVEKPADTVMYFTLFNERNVYESDNYVCALAPGFPDGKKDFIAYCDGSVRTFLKKDFPADPMEFFQKHVFLPGSFQ